MLIVVYRVAQTGGQQCNKVTLSKSQCFIKRKDVILQSDSYLVSSFIQYFFLFNMICMSASFPFAVSYTFISHLQVQKCFPIEQFLFLILIKIYMTNW